MIFFETEADPTQWFLLPLHWTKRDKDKVKEWSKTCAEIMTVRDRNFERTPSRMLLTKYFRMLAEAHPNPAIPANQAFLYSGDPFRIPQPFYALVVQSEGEDPQTGLRIVVQAAEKNPAYPPDVVPFSSGRLGEGLRCLRYFNDGGQMCVSLNYGWWIKELQAYVSLRTVTGDIGWLMAQDDVFDDFARSVWLNPDPRD